jgi:hypothetical protein
MPNAALTDTRHSLTYRPWRVWVSEILTVLFLATIVAVVAWLGLRSPWGYVTGAVAATAGLALASRALRIGLVVTESTVWVSNYWTTYVIPWAEIQGIGIGLKGWPGRPALLFRRRDQPPVLALATPARHEEWVALRTAILGLAPSSVQRHEEVLSFSFVGADWAISNRLRLWWLGEPLRPDPNAVDQAWPEQPFGFSLIFATLGLLAAAVALILGTSLLVGSITSGAPAYAYLVAVLLLLIGSLGCIGLLKLRRSTRRDRPV